MRTLTVAALVCTLMVLDGAAASSNKHTVVKRALRLCPYGWTRYYTRCFLYVQRSRTWAGAEKYCQYLGGNLASVHSFWEYLRLQRVVWRAAHRYQQAWIGGSDAQQERQWFWSDGSPFRYQKWCPREPNNHGPRGQHCLHINHGAGRCWDDLQCYRRAPFVCARKVRRFLG